jgi:hypothetical protein
MEKHILVHHPIPGIDNLCCIAIIGAAAELGIPMLAMTSIDDGGRLIVSLALENQWEQILATAKPFFRKALLRRLDPMLVPKVMRYVYSEMTRYDA